MTESLPTRVRRTIEDNLVAAVGTATLALLTTLWALWSSGLYARLHAALGDRGVLALVFGLVAAVVWCVLGWRQEKKKHSSEGLPVGFTLDTKSGISVEDRSGKKFCTKCLHRKRKSELCYAPPPRHNTKGFACVVHDCQASYGEDSA
jgi:hypothetical protein